MTETDGGEATTKDEREDHGDQSAWAPLVRTRQVTVALAGQSLGTASDCAAAAVSTSSHEDPPSVDTATSAAVWADPSSGLWFQENETAADAVDTTDELAGVLGVGAAGAQIVTTASE